MNNVSDGQAPADLRERLILSGLSEISGYGIRDFSLRRVAQRAEVSCAAPYRHFRSKDELILAVFSYIDDAWRGFAAAVLSAYSDPAELTVALCLSNIRFWYANSSFRTALISGFGDIGRGVDSAFSSDLLDSVGRYAASAGKSREETSILVYSARCVVYGTVLMLDTAAEPEGLISAAEDMLRRTFGKEKANA